MASKIDAPTLKRWLSDGHEIALIDVREAGQFGEAHPLFAAPLPYSRFETGLIALVPRRSVRLVLVDGGDGVALRAARRAKVLGYTDVAVLDGGVQAWRAAGFALFAGVNVPSKVLGELVEHVRRTPHISAADVVAKRDRQEPFVIVDGRPLEEFHRMSIPGGICCPNGELALRIDALVPDSATPVVVNCAGRTRSIIGAQTLIEIGVPNPVMALENGTQGWFLAGLELERGAARRYSNDVPAAEALTKSQHRARAFAERHGVSWATAAGIRSWLSDESRTTFLLDVRTAEEVSRSAAPGFTHAPGGQLVQATDQWVGVRGARLVVMDEEEVRAPVIAAWLRQLGHEAVVLQGGVAAGREVGAPVSGKLQLTRPRHADLGSVAEALAKSGARLVDLRASAAYSRAHIAGAVWSTRPRIAHAVAGWQGPVLLVAEDADAAALAAIDIMECGVTDIAVVEGGEEAWRAAGLDVVATPGVPQDRERIDFLFFVHDRHHGNRESARRYLEWETGLLAQLDDAERAAFNL